MSLKTPPRRHELTDEQCERLRPLLPPQKPHTGRPSKGHRTVINGILWIIKTGAPWDPWEDLPERYGSYKTVSSRFYHWRKVSIWDKIFAEVQKDADTKGLVEWKIHFVDSSIVRAHQHAAVG
jgi:transposase